jgi:predicted  nucleic acid-binding Zn-ribbon protein
MPGNVTNERLRETLKAIRSRRADMASDLTDLKADMRELKGHMAAFMQSEVAQDGAIASIQAKIDRIERRLDLSEA